MDEEKCESLGNKLVFFCYFYKTLVCFFYICYYKEKLRVFDEIERLLFQTLYQPLTCICGLKCYLGNANLCPKGTS